MWSMFTSYDILFLNTHIIADHGANWYVVSKLISTSESLHRPYNITERTLHVSSY